MTSQYALLNRKVVKGPGKIELLQAAFFTPDLTLQFWFNDQDSILGTMVGYFPHVGMHQMCIVVVEYHPERGCIDKAVIRYDHHLRDGVCLDSSISIEAIRRHDFRVRIGTAVKTTRANPNITDWTPEALAQRQWDTLGEVVKCHDSHGICYDVRHPDSSVGSYDPTEFIGAL